MINFTPPTQTRRRGEAARAVLVIAPVTGRCARGSNQSPLAVRSVDDEAFLWRVSHAACTKLPLGRVARPDPLMGF